MPWRPVLVILAAASALVPLPATFVERVYSRRLYLALQPLLTSLSNLAPFALFDCLLIGVALSWLVLSVRDLRTVKGRLRAGVVILWRTIVWAAALYVIFLCTWGLNYRRVRLADILGLDSARVTAPAVKDAAIVAAGRLNDLYGRAHAASAPAALAIDQPLAAALERALADTGRPQTVVPGRPKETIIDWYFRRAAVDGMTNPFFLEILVQSDLLPFERPFVTAHEWSHLAGVADEGEANFVGWLACVRGSPAAQYSGWLFMYSELLSVSSRTDRVGIAAALAAGPREDLQAIRERVARHVSPRLSAAGWRVYDSYLKANRVESGAASYGEVVQLALGARLASGSSPFDLGVGYRIGYGIRPLGPPGL
jgi:Protein of unknown function (DUF3810)